MDKNVLITGGAGFIGANLTNRLIDEGYRVTVLDNLLPQIHGDYPEETSQLYRSVKDKTKFIMGSVTSRADLEVAIAGQDLIIHLAAETGTGQSMYDIAHYTNVNIEGTALLLDCLANSEHSVRKIIFSSSRAIYGEGKYWKSDVGYVYPGHRDDDDMKAGNFEVYDGPDKLPLIPIATDEESKIHPSSVYGITKHNQEQLIMTICPVINIAAVSFRFQNVYGPGQSLNNPYTGILSIFSTLIRNGREINIFEDGKETRDFVYIDDVVDAIILGIEKEEANNEVFNVGTGVPTNVLTVVQELITNYEKPTAQFKITGNYRLGDIRHNFADITKIQRALGFQPKYTFREGLKNFCGWVNTQQAGADHYFHSIEVMKQKGMFK